MNWPDNDILVQRAIILIVLLLQKYCKRINCLRRMFMIFIQEVIINRYRYFMKQQNQQPLQPQQQSPNKFQGQQSINLTVTTSQQATLSPTKVPQHDPDVEAPLQLPSTGEQIIQYMKKKPYTQFLSGVQLTYSLLPKKQDTFLLTHQRFLMLKGIESISYARVFPQKQELPFRSLQEVLKPKTTFNLSQVAKVEPGKDEKLIIHFSGPKKLTWEFHCPSVSCAFQWRKKIEEAVELHNEYIKSGVKTLDEFLQLRQTNAYQVRISAQKQIDISLGKGMNGNNGGLSIFDKGGQNNATFNLQSTTNNNQFNANIGASKFTVAGTGSSNFNSNSGLNVGLNVNPSSNINTSIWDNKANISGGFNTQSPVKTSTSGANLNFSIGGNSPSISANINSGNNSPIKRNMNESNFTLNNSPTKGGNFNVSLNTNTPIVGGNFNNQFGTSSQTNTQFGSNNQFNTNNNQFGNNNQFNTSNNQFGGNATFGTSNQQFGFNTQDTGVNNQFGSIDNNQRFGNNNISVNVSSGNKSMSPNKPTAIQFKGPQISKMQDFMTNANINNSQHTQPFLGKSMSKITSNEKDGFMVQLNRTRRNWVQELVGGEEEGQLIIDFKNYVEKVTSVIINELYIPQNEKIFPHFQINNDHASYVVDDIYVEIYFFNQENVDKKHQRYQQAVLQFKNFDYLLTVTKNQGILKVPFFVHFQHKGFLGIAKSKVGDSAAPKNRECISQLNIKQFQQTSRISAETLLNQSKCRILSYERKTSLSKTTASNRRIYFVDRLTELLPLQSGDMNNGNPTKVLRAQLLQDDQFDGTVFRDKRRPVNHQKIAQVIDNKQREILRILENQEEYFTNSKELEDLLHFSGLNIRNLGNLLLKSRLVWLKKIVQAEILARSFKNFFRCDIQSCVRVQADRITKKQKQETIEHQRVISFLNLIFGVSESSQGLWKRVNNYSKNNFGTFAFENNYSDINIHYFLQSIQTHFKIVLSDKIHSKQFFKNDKTLEYADFLRFDYETKIYNLDFTNTFQQINQCLEEKTQESFGTLREIITKQTSTKIPYLQILKKHPIHDRICQFLLDFTSPEQSRDLYNRLETNPLPSRYIFESKLAEIKWYLKEGKINQIGNPVKFIFQQAFRWLGQIHPLFVQINRILAMYFCDHKINDSAIKYAHDCLEMQKKIYGGDYDIIMWKDYLLVGKAFFASKRYEEGMQNLFKAKEMVKPQSLKQNQSFSQLNLLLCHGFYLQKKFQQAFNLAKDTYNLLKNEKNEQSLFYILEAVGWMKQVLQSNKQYEMYYQFLQTDFSNHIKSFIYYPELLFRAIKMITVPSLKNAIIRRSKNRARLMTLVQELQKLTKASQSTLVVYVNSRINNGSFPRNFLNQLKDVDRVVDQIVTNQLFDRWKEFYQTSNQATLDKLSSADVNRGFQFLANITSLFNCFGKGVLDQMHLMEK